MKALPLVVAVASAVSMACAGTQTVENDAGFLADGVQLEFSQTVTISSADPRLPHGYPAHAARSFWFYGWPVAPGETIALSWHPAAAALIGVWWIPWEEAVPLPAPGRLDDFEDGDLRSELGAEWVAVTYGSDGPPPPLRVLRDNAGAHLALETVSSGSLSVALEVSPLDVSGYAGVYVRMASAVPANVAVELMARDPCCCDGYRFENAARPAAVSQEITEYRFPLDAFTAEPGHCPEASAPVLRARLIHLALFVTAAEVGTLRVYEIGFYAAPND